MSRFSRALTAPLRLASGARRAGSDRWPRLPRPTLSVGNLALGGRGKTPLVAALAAHALAAGAHPAILLRGYPRVRRGQPPQLLLRPGPAELPWTSELESGAVRAQSHAHAMTCGEEAAWLAAVTGAPVGAHPDRARAAAAVLASHPDVDLFLLDDGLQTPIQPDVDVVLVDPNRDLVHSPDPAATRERDDRLPPDAWIVRLGVDVMRRQGALRGLDGLHREPSALPPLTVCAGVGDPASVHRLALAAGLSVGGSITVRDHGAPTARQLAGRTGPLLVTEKDAVRWAAAMAPSDCVVLQMRLTGSDAIWERARPLLGSLA